MHFSQNELTHGGTTSEGLIVVIRIAAMGRAGRRHLEILRTLALGTTSVLTDNHVIPLWKEVDYEDMTFIVCPFVGHSMDDCYGWWAKNSVGDIIDMILQALEVRPPCSAPLMQLKTRPRPSYSCTAEVLCTEYVFH